MSLAVSISVHANILGVSAFHGRFHKEIANRTAEAAGLMTAREARLYESGAFLADIGRFNWDNYYENSDSALFADCMMSQCSSSDETWFAQGGWCHHVVHDTKGSVIGNIFGSGNYTVLCARFRIMLQE